MKECFFGKRNEILALTVEIRTRRETEQTFGRLVLLLLQDLEFVKSRSIDEF